MGKTNNYFNNNEPVVRILEFNKKKYKIKENFYLSYFVTKKLNEIDEKGTEEDERLEAFKNEESQRLAEYIAQNGTDEGFEHRTYRMKFNEGYERLTAIRNILTEVAGEEFLKNVEQLLNTNDFMLMFNIVMNMVGGMDEDEAFDTAMKQQKKIIN